MKTKLLIILCLLSFGRISGQTNSELTAHKTNQVEKDIFDRVVMDENGNKINYTWQETEGLLPVATKQTEGAGKNSAKVVNGTMYNCNAEWKYSVMGTYIGRRSMNTADIDNDGKIEIVCSARPMDYSNGCVWYVMRFDSVHNDYRHVWISDFYDNMITSIKLFDVNWDGILEAVVGFDNGKVLIFSGTTKALIGQITLPVTSSVNDIEYGDADNDGLFEIGISISNKIYFYTPTNFTLKSQILYGAFDFKIGNVDTDPYNEIVTTLGKVLQYNGVTTTLDWNYDAVITSDNGCMLELSDVDSDGLQEVIRTKTWYYIDVYDVNLQALKYEINSGIDVNALLVQDVTNDGVAEIIIGDGQWGHVHCYNAVTHLQNWQISNPEHGVTAVNIADVNHDGVLEVLWGAGASSTGADYLLIADITTHLIEWTSVAIDGPFHAIAIDDVDNDGTKEIVAVSYESESGYASGIVSVFNAMTKELEWQCNGSFFYQIWTGIYDVKIIDIDNDGHKEIIVAAGQTYTGEIWIIDGITKAIKSSHIFNTEDLDDFQSLDIADVDSDGNLEIIVANETNYYILTPSTWAIEYTSGNFTGGYIASKIKVENIDNDAEKEIVYCNNYIHVQGGITHSIWQSTDNNYSNFDLYDMTGDGKKDIVAGTSTGYIKVLDGVTLQIVSSIQLSSYKIDGIVVTNLNSDTIPEIVFTTNGTINIYSGINQYLTTKKFGIVAGAYNGLYVGDYDNDAVKEIIAGTTGTVMQLTENCFQCMWFTTNNTVLNRSCGTINDGSITVTPSGAAPYVFTWSNGSTNSILNNLSVGTYIYTVTDNYGCIIVDTLSVQQSQLIANYTSTHEYCNPSQNGTATVNITTGTPPYTFLWSNGANTAVANNLLHGTYSVTVNDSRNCSINHSYIIVKDTLYLNYTKSDAICYGGSSGYIHLTPQGTSPYVYSWNTGQSSANLNYIPAGVYTANVVDAHGCVASTTVTISQPTQMISQTTSTPDNSGTPFGDGTATVNVYGGTPVYTLVWNDPFAQTSITAINLFSGSYIVTVTDHNGCIVKDTAIVGTITSITESNPNQGLSIYPNPSHDIVFLDLTTDGAQCFDLKIYNILGDIVLSVKVTKSDKSLIPIDMSGFGSGIYNINISNEKYNYSRKLQLIK